MEWNFFLLRSQPVSGVFAGTLLYKDEHDHVFMLQFRFEFELLTCNGDIWTMELQNSPAAYLYPSQTGTHAAEERSRSIGGDDERVVDALRVHPVPGSHSQPAHTG